MNDKIMISVFMALEGIHAYSAFLPSVFTIKTFVDSEEGVRMIREGEVFASAFLLTLAIVTGNLTKSWYPVVFGLTAGGLMIAVYEYALMRCPAND